jgi:hypothetical protein
MHFATRCVAMNDLLRHNPANVVKMCDKGNRQCLLLSSLL